MKRVAILGSTGSIGRSALNLIARAPDRFTVVGLAAGSNYQRLSEQISRFRPRLASVCAGADECVELNAGVEVSSGPEGLCRVAAMPEADVVLIAVAGAAALAPTLCALAAGKPVALASKEALVMAGELVMATARSHGATILPVDSEHSGIFQALAGRSAAWMAFSTSLRTEGSKGWTTSRRGSGTVMLAMLRSGETCP